MPLQRVGYAVSATLLVAIFSNSAEGQVVPDGTTNTTVTLSADGTVTVGVAPPTANGVSLNNYDTFNVGKPGVDLDNRSAAARTIVNEVTGTESSRLEGNLSVIGKRAHVIVANPNGIVIDGGRFINTGRVALTTGGIGSERIQVAPGFYRDDITTNVQQGRITIEGGGLSGKMDAIDLIAHDLRINGPITNTSEADGSAINLQAGASLTRFDSGVIPGNSTAQWAYSQSSGDTTNGVVIDWLQPGVLRANRIEILANGAGAGVRMAGSGFATAQNFTLSSQGQVKIEGAQIQAAQATAIEGKSIEANQSVIAGDTSASLSAVGAITLNKSDIRSQDGSVLISAGGSLQANETDIDALGHLLVDADDISIAAGDEQAIWRAQSGSLILSTSGVTTSGELRIEGVLLQGGTRTEGLSNSAGTASAGGVTLNVAGDVNLRSTDAALTVLFSGGGDLQFSLGGSLTNVRGRLISNGDLRLDAVGSIDNLLSETSDSPKISNFNEKGSRLWYTFWLARERVSGELYDYGTVENPDQTPTILAADAMQITAANLVNQGGEISANGGDIAINAQTVSTRGVPSGKVAVRKICALRCSYESSGSVDLIGGRINATGSIDINATESFRNTGGQVYAQNNLTITAPKATTESFLTPVLVQRPAGLYNFWSSKAAWIFLRDEFGTLVAENGNLSINSLNPLRVIGGELTAGGDISLEGGEEIVRAPGTYSAALGHQIGLLRGLPLIHD